MISSVIYYGRISNIKITLLELLAMAAAGGRTPVVPELSECAVDGYDRSFGGIFDDSTPLTRRALSLGSFDFAAACNGSAVFIDPGHFPGGPHGTASLGDLRIPGEAPHFPVVNVVDLPPTPGDVVFGKAAGHALLGTKGFTTTSEMAAGPIHSLYYAPGQRRTFEGYRKDPLLLEKVASRPEKCIVLGKNFQAVNWERAPELFVGAVRGLMPAPPIRAAALAFLGAHGLAGGGEGGCPLGAPSAAAALPPEAMARALSRQEAEREGLAGWGQQAQAQAQGQHFLGIHLRMGDFLTDDGHKSFGVVCNGDPEGTIGALVAGALEKAPHLGKIVVATDDYGSACFQRGLKARWGDRVLTVQGASGYRGPTCSAALFDQEVLGHSGAFLGDKESSFSEAIHRVRTLRCGAPVASTTWL